MEWKEFISLENIYIAWKDFSAGKRGKRDVMLFEVHLEDELWRLCEELRERSYVHGSYERFIVHDPKSRVIHKALIRDRLVHRMLYNYLLSIFNPRWLDCSFSCRPGFGQHVSIRRVSRALLQATSNYTKVCIAFKCDVRKFFDHIDHKILFRLLCKRVRAEPFQSLLWQVIKSFCAGDAQGRGVPIGNLTSQIFANAYLHEIDCYVKRALKIHWYFRYADDLLIITTGEDEARRIIDLIERFLEARLRLELHPDKTIIRKTTWGIDWLGQVLLPGYRVLRPSTRRRMMRNIKECVAHENNFARIRSMLASYDGLIKDVAHRGIARSVMQEIALYRGI